MTTWGPTTTGANADDGSEAVGSSTWYASDPLADDHLYLGYSSDYGGQLTVGLRFPNVTVPKGATITSATIGMYWVAGDGSSAIRADVYARAHDNAPVFDSTTRPSNCSKTTGAYVNTARPGSPGAITLTGLASVIQAITDRAGWASGNAIALALIPRDADYADIDTHQFYEYEQGSNRPTLTIEYTEGGVTNSDITPTVGSAALTGVAGRLDSGILTPSMIREA